MRGPNTASSAAGSGDALMNMKECRLPENASGYEK